MTALYVGLARAPERRARCSPGDATLTAVTALVVTLLWHPSLAVGFLVPDKDDSFLTLTTGRAAGLACIAVVTGAAIFMASHVKTQCLIRHRYPITADIALTVLLAILALTLSPQLFYAYYRPLFGLPAQWVVQWPAAETIAAWFLPAMAQDLAARGTALLLWSLCLAAMLDGSRSSSRGDDHRRGYRRPTW